MIKNCLTVPLIDWCLRFALNSSPSKIACLFEGCVCVCARAHARIALGFIQFFFSPLQDLIKNLSHPTHPLEKGFWHMLSLKLLEGRVVWGFFFRRG